MQEDGSGRIAPSAAFHAPLSLTHAFPLSFSAERKKKNVSATVPISDTITQDLVIASHSSNKI